MKKNAKKIIIKNMIYLMNQYELEKITIKMICAYSDVNRSTFYKYFQDKYDLFESVQNFHFTRYKKLMNSLENSIHHTNKINKVKVEQAFRIIFKYILKYRQFFNAVTIFHPQRALLFEYSDFTKKKYQKILLENLKLTKIDYFIEYIIGGQISMIITWLRNGCKDSPDKMAKLMLANISRDKARYES